MTEAIVAIMKQIQDQQKIRHLHSMPKACPSVVVKKEDDSALQKTLEENQENGRRFHGLN
ncbi:hypothetical protein BVRB_003420 [Beta vulgaris subsp. vulgaris]|uniref:Uncharacterized protein n=1 Tax=Beta vulgaris subsp. vulgaris TaxID=3555 RepID=A0A0J8B861_BETVV|nr:hypothetical protein BVRB_003420 [Beta vulgaris subsp. vulgaris]